MQRALSPHDREYLLARVEGLLAGRNIPGDTLRRAVYEVCAALGSAGASGGPGVLMVATASAVPDLASRVRTQLSAVGLGPDAMGMASVGRHAVVTLRVASGARVSAERALQQAGFLVSVVDGISRELA